MLVEMGRASCLFQQGWVQQAGAKAADLKAIGKKCVGVVVGLQFLLLLSTWPSCWARSGAALMAQRGEWSKSKGCWRKRIAMPDPYPTNSQQAGSETRPKQLGGKRATEGYQTGLQSTPSQFTTSSQLFDQSGHFGQLHGHPTALATHTEALHYNTEIVSPVLSNDLTISS